MTGHRNVRFSTQPAEKYKKNEKNFLKLRKTRYPSVPAWDIWRFQEVFVRSRALAAADFPWEKCMVIQYNADGEKQRKRDWLSYKTDEGSSSPFFYILFFQPLCRRDQMGQNLSCVESIMEYKEEKQRVFYYWPCLMGITCIT